MRPILFSIGNFYVSSYMAFMFLAVTAALALTIIRTRKGPIDSNRLVPALVAGLLCGWLLSRATLLMLPEAKALGWRVFSPTVSQGGSLTYFGIGAALGTLGFLFMRRQPVLPIADAVAPSILWGVGISKIGCLLGGCCAGALCPSWLGISYPFGSIVHEDHFARGIVSVPKELQRAESDQNPDSLLLGHLQLLKLEQDFAMRQGPSASVTTVTPELIQRATEHHSLPIWPAPLMMSFAAIGCALAAEKVYRRPSCTGTTFAFVLIAYGVLRLTLDWFIEYRGTTFAGLSSAQWLAIFGIAFAIALKITMRHAPFETSR